MSNREKEAWRLDFVKDLQEPLPSFGAVCSPLLDGDSLIVQAGNSVVKLNKSTGELIWKTVPAKRGSGMNDSPFSSPVIGTLHGKRQLIVQGRKNLKGIDLDTGSELWSTDVPAFRGMNILTPLVHENSVITSTYGGGTFRFDVSSKDDGTLGVEEAWKTTKQGYMSSPVLIGETVYLHLRNQRFTCFDPKDGETKWTTNPFGKYWSMAINGTQILALDQRGELRLIEATPTEFKQISSRTVSESSTWAHVAVSGDNLFIREQNGIAAWQWK